MRDVFHSVHVARGVHDTHFHNDNAARGHSNAEVGGNSILECNMSIEAQIYKKNNHGTMRSARKRNLLKEDSM